MQNSMIARRVLLAGMAFGVALVLWPGWVRAATPPENRPNIIFILADDLGIDALGCYGGDDFKTPVLDGLAARGIRFERAYCTPICGPTRAQLITGQYPFRNGAIDIDGTMNAAKPDTCPSLPATLKRAGYATGMTGKWKQLKLDPGDWGFDQRLVSPTANGHYWAKNWSLNGQEIAKAEDVYFPDVMSDFALEFIRKHKAEPFFFYYALTNPHVPIVHTPDTVPGVTDEKQLYADNIAYIDKLVGRLMAELEKQGLRDNTLIMFSGDNGSLGNVAGKVKGRRLDGAKAQMREGGAHVPLIANWPAVIRPGQVSGDLVDFSDLLPTFAELAGGQLPTDKGQIDGRSFAPQLRGEKGNPREWIYVQLGQDFYVRSDRYRLDHKGDLYDVSEEPFAARQLEPGDAPEARAKLQKVLDDLNPKAGKTYDKWQGFGTRRPSGQSQSKTRDQKPGE
jgi:arylsulfatase A